MSDLNNIDFENMTPADFEEFLPDLFATGNGRVSEDPRLRKFLDAHPDCAALVRDLETIAEHAKSLFDPVEEPSDEVWEQLKKKLQTDPAADN
jgi:hypothetical protein